MSHCPLSTSLPRRALLLAAMLLASWSGLSARAAAAEQIVLPFECNVVGGRVQVRPSDDRAYRIYGTRRQDQYRACSEQNPDRCRTFLVHSFTMACGRDRAEWPDVYAAIAKVTDGRAFYNNDGALYYRMGPREPRDSYPFPEPRRATGIVEMPDGFAPMAGVDAIFTPLDPRVAELEGQGAPREDSRDPAFAPDLSSKAAEKPKPSTGPKIVEAPQPAESKPAESKPADSKPTETASTGSAPAPAPAESLAAQKPAEKASDPPAAAAAPPVAPTILNIPAAKEVEAASKTETIVAAAEITPAPQSAAKPGTAARVEGWSATQGPGLSVPPLAIAVVIAALTLATLLVILKKQSEAPAAAGPLRVPIEPTLPGFDPLPEAKPGQEMIVRDAPVPPAASAVPATASDMPRTRDEALAVLGLSSGATDAAIRKVVEALRQSWHPDLATGDADRVAREDRIKAINVAAGILLRKTAA